MKTAKSCSNSSPLSRRSLVGGLAAAPLIYGVAPRRAWAANDSDTIVIGGGLSGLSAALTLEAAGQRVRLLEASNRLGGRCFTLKTNDGAFDCGATTIGPLYGRIRAFGAQAGVQLKTPPGRDPFSYNFGGVFVPRSEWKQSLINPLSGEERDIMPESLEFTLVQKHNVIKELTAWRTDENLLADIPLDDFLRRRGVSKEALQFIGISTNARSIKDVSALFQMREFARLALPLAGDNQREVYAAGADGGFNYVEGGMSNLIDGMAGLLQSEPQLRAPVVAINVEDDGVDVEVKDGTRYRTRAVICTAPYSVLKDIKITPSIDGLKAKAIKKARYTSTTHVFCIPREPYWEDDGASAGLYTDDIIERVFANKDDDGNVAWLDVWINGSSASKVDKMSDCELMDLTVRRLAGLRPATQGKVEAVAVYSWGKNEFIRGNKHVLRGGEVGDLFPALAAPWRRRLRFAGEHTRDTEAGMEAAAATGMREAFAVLDGV